MYELRRTGKAISFKTVGIGNPFFAHGKIWIRVDYDAAKQLVPSDMHSSVCNFVIAASDEAVEFVNYYIDGVPVIPEDRF